MKTYLFTLLLISCLLSCKKEIPIKESDPYYYFDGTLTANRNGKKWEPKLLCIFEGDEKFAVSVIDYRDGFIWDGLTIEHIYLTKKNATLEDRRVDSLNNSPLAWYNGSFNQGSDVPSSNYLRKDRPRSITIRSYDSASKTVSGTFSLSFMRDSTYATLGIRLDTVSYTEGFFSATIHNPDELPR